MAMPRSFGSSQVTLACGQKPRASYGKWAKPLREGHGKTQRFRHSSVSLWPRSGDAAPACPGFLTKCGLMGCMVVGPGNRLGVVALTSYVLTVRTLHQYHTAASA